MATITMRYRARSPSASSTETRAASNVFLLRRESRVESVRVIHKKRVIATSRPRRIVANLLPLLAAAPNPYTSSCHSCVMSSEAVSLPKYFCDLCQKQCKPQGYSNHRKKCINLMEKRERDQEYESHQALEEEARHARLWSPKRCMSSQFYGAVRLCYSHQLELGHYDICQ